MKLKLSLKAIILGLVVDFVGTMAFFIVAGIIASVIYILRGNDINNFVSDYYSNILLMTASLILGLLFTFLGGFVTGKLSKGYELQNSTAFGIIGLVLGLFFCSELPFWYNLLGFLLIVPCAYAGGVVAQRINRRTSQINT